MEVKTTVEFPSRNGYWMKSVWSEDKETLEAVLDENGNPKECSYRDIVEWEQKEDEEKIGDEEGWPSSRILEETFDMDQSAGERMIEKLLFEDEPESLAMADILSKLGCLDSPGSDDWRRRIMDRLFLDKNVQIRLMASDLAEDWKEIEALKTAIANEDTSWVKWEMETALAHLERQGGNMELGAKYWKVMPDRMPDDGRCGWGVYGGRLEPRFGPDHHWTGILFFADENSALRFASFLEKSQDVKTKVVAKVWGKK